MYQLVYKQQDLSIIRACACLDVSRSGYYAWLQRSLREDDLDPFEGYLKSQMEKIALIFPDYGYRRMTRHLRRSNIVVNHKKTLKLMGKYQLLCQRKRKFVKTTNSDHNHPIYPNLAKDLKPTSINQLWVADITYIPFKHRYLYFAFILDVFSRRCLGWELDRYIDAKLTLSALKKALKTRHNQNLNQLVHHSDRAKQYAAHIYIQMLIQHEITISMSRKGNPYDNAYAESFVKTIKYAEVYLNEYQSFKQAYLSIECYVENVYNQKRLHSAIGYRSPIEYEMYLNKLN